MVVVYGRNKMVREFGKNSDGAWILAQELMAKGLEVWVIDKMSAHSLQLL